MKAVRLERYTDAVAQRFVSLQRSAQAEFVGSLPHEPDHIRDVRLERQAKFLSALAQIVPGYGPGEGLVLHPLDDGRRLEVENALRGTHQRRGGDEPAQLVTREQRLLQGGLAGDPAVVGVRQDRPRDPLGVPQSLQDLDTR